MPTRPRTRLPDSVAAPSPRRRLGQDTGGAIYVEFLIAFIPFFIMFLGMVQIALYYSADLIVRHAAAMAARSAIVVLPDDPADYSGAPVNRLGGGGGGSQQDAVRRLLGWAGLRGGGAPAAGSGSGGARMSAIRSAASLPLLSISPSMEQLVPDESIYRVIGGDPADRAAAGSSLYNRMAVAVTFPSGPGGTGNRTSFGEDEDITVRVTYLFHCGIPVASRLMCHTYRELRDVRPHTASARLANAADSGASSDSIARLSRMVQRSEQQLQRAQPGMSELGNAESPWIGFVTSISGARFKILRAEATLRNHGAPYQYRGGSGGGGPFAGGLP